MAAARFRGLTGDWGAHGPTRIRRQRLQETARSNHRKTRIHRQESCWLVIVDEQSKENTEPVSDQSETNLSYYGWRVVLAACLGVMAGFGSLFVYTFTVFVKPLGAALSVLAGEAS